MRLINITTGLLTFVEHPNIPRYAVLSHRWVGEETTFEEYQRDPHHSSQHASPNPGRRKIQDFCAFVRARNQGHAKPIHHVWIDTVCIDKRSSAELSEAINSMASWYRDAVYCVAYLFDISGPAVSVSKSEWFTRGWCLQELLIPSEIVFVDCAWRELGTKTSTHFVQLLSVTTGIDEACLRDTTTMQRQCAAKKMSWMSGRVCSRPEDVAYSLLGLFNIHLPPLYGEGELNAFMRLQEEIVRQTDDESIFAWSIPNDEYPKWESLDEATTLLRAPSVFAPHPRYFLQQRHAHLAGTMKRAPYRLTNKGLEFESQGLMMHNPQLGPTAVFVLELNCGSPSAGQDRSFLLALHRNRRGRYERLEAPGSSGGSYIWDFVSGVIDPKHTKMAKRDRQVYYIRATGAVQALGALPFSDENYLTVGKFLSAPSGKGRLSKYREKDEEAWTYGRESMHGAVTL